MTRSDRDLLRRRPGRDAPSRADEIAELWRDPGTEAARRERAAAAQLERFLEAATRPGPPLAVGPWRSEVGFEVLYWIPFVRHLVAVHAIDPGRLVAISRGGVSSWYEGLCGRYVDLLDVLGAEELRSAGARVTAERRSQKQDSSSTWDDRLLGAAGFATRRERRTALHPQVMYGLFGRFWRGGEPLQAILDRLQHVRWRPPVDHELEQLLPEDYVAVKFYFRDSFPDTPPNREFVRLAVERTAERTAVVILDVNIQLDDHVEAAIEAGPGGRVLAPLRGAAPERNLHVQSVALARAKAFLGTYGGFSYLAGAYGVPCLSLASDPLQFFPAHVDLARRAAAATETQFAVLDVRSLDLVRRAPTSRPR